MIFPDLFSSLFSRFIIRYAVLRETSSNSATSVAVKYRLLSGILQNQFTAFLTVAVSNARIDYLRARIRRLQRELVTKEYEILFSENYDYIEALSENDALHQAMQTMKEKERYVVLARILDEKGFDEIADELGMGYKGVAAIYYRAIRKLKNILGGEDS